MIIDTILSINETTLNIKAHKHYSQLEDFYYYIQNS